MEKLLQNLVYAAQRYLNNKDDAAILSQLEHKIDAVNQVLDEYATSTTFNNTRVADNLSFTECLHYLSAFLSSPDCPTFLLTKTLTFFYTLVWNNVVVRKYCQKELNLSVCLSLCLNQIVDKYSNVALVLQILKLYEVISHRCDEVSWTSSLPDLILYFVRTVCQSTKSSLNAEILPFCLGSLNNLCTQSTEVQEYIRRLDVFESFSEGLLSLLQNSRTSVVINSLSIMISLNEKLKDMVLNSNNFPQTFQCVFNVLNKGDTFMARHHAVNLISRLIDQASVRPLITKYKYLSQMMHNICVLFVTLDPQFEQLSNIYDLFLRFCDFDELKSVACNAIAQSGPVNPNRLTTPLLAVLECAKIPCESCLVPHLPLKALQLLTHVIKHKVEGNNRIQNYVSCDVLTRLIEDSLKSPIETGHPLVVEKCERMYLCLRLASVSSSDDEIRSDLLEIVTPALCAHIFEFQMVSNPVSFTGASASKPAEWTIYGVRIVLSLISFLRLLEPISPAHKEIYWRFLKDSRIVPFVAFAFVSGDKKLVDQAFAVSFRMAQLDGFTSSWLSELIANNARANISNAQGSGNLDSSSSVIQQSASSSMPIDETTIDELIEKMRNGMRINDPKITQILEIYERKIAATQLKERQLQELIEAKTAALQQSDRVINQYRGARQEAELEASKMRSVVYGAEAKCETAAGQVANLKAELESSRNVNRKLEERCKNLEVELDASKDNISDFTLRVASLQQANEVGKREIESERELHNLLRKHYENMKQNFEVTSQKFLEVEEELKSSKKQLKESQTAVNEMTEIVEKLESTLAKKEEENKLHERSVKSLRSSLDAVEKEKKLLTKQITDLENEVSRKLSLIKEHERTITKMKDDIDKHSQIAQMIHKMTGGVAPK